MRKIAIITATRAEYGLLAPIVRRLREYEDNEFRVELVVTGTHLSREYGCTVQEIVEDGVRIDHEVQVSIASSLPNDISRNQAELLVKFTDLFSSEKYNAVLLLGDRYEMISFAIAAMNTHTPIFHVSGGDITECAMDDSIRHALTKMSYLHFTSNEESRRRVVQMGEHPSRVFNFGSTSIDNMMDSADMDLDEVLEEIGLHRCCYALCTYHPVTLGSHNIKEQMEGLLEAIRKNSGIEFIVTRSNADQGGSLINQILDENEAGIPNLHVYSSLGVKRYLSLMRYAEFVLGNSSSGIIEAPSFHIPTVNIGDRQKGRLKAQSVIDCQEDPGSIMGAIKTALSEEMRQVCRNIINPYGNGRAAEKIAQKCREVVRSEINLQKKFYLL